MGGHGRHSGPSGPTTTGHTERGKGVKSGHLGGTSDHTASDLAYRKHHPSGESEVSAKKRKAMHHPPKKRLGTATDPIGKYYLIDGGTCYKRLPPAVAMSDHLLNCNHYLPHLELV